jgi:hypothetical protein
MRKQNTSGMQENEFEKQLKKKMEEFQLPPSDSVWEKISRSIHNNQRRKKPFIFLLIIGLLTAGYFVYHASEKHPQSNNYTNSKTDNLKQNNDSIFSKDSGKLSVQRSFDKKDTSDVYVNAKGNVLKNDIKVYNKENNPAIALINNIAHTKSISPIKNSLQKVQDNNSNKVEQINAPSIKQNNITVLNNPPVYEDSSFISQSITIKDSAAQIPQNNITGTVSSNKDSIIIKESNDDSSLKKATKNSLVNMYKTPNWQWGINAFYGRSNIVEGLISSDKSLPQYLSNPGPGGFYDTIFHNKHPYTSSAAYGFGALIQKKVAKHSFIIAGINYTHLSVKSDIGKTIDTAITISSFNGTANYFINRYAQPGPIKKYISNYNFIELPVYFQQEILHARNFSFSYNAGISLRQLISSNALLYNQYNNVYFSKNDLLRKTQFQFMTGLNFKFNSGKNSSVYIGPQLTYSLSDLIKNSSNNNFHFINYGLHAGLLLHKK